MFKFLLLLFPRDMRDEFGADMQQLYRHHRDHIRGFGVARLWIATVVDAVRHGIGARLELALGERESNGRHDAQPQKGLLMDSFSHDVRYALRMFRKQPAVTATMLLTLALGIGANTAVFSVVHAVLLRDLPYPQPQQLVIIHEKRPAEGVMNNVVSPADFLDWSRLNRSFSTLAAFMASPADLTGAGDPVQLTVGGVTSRFFDVFGVRPLHGRTFAPDEDVLGQHRVAMLSYGLWQQRFGSDPSIVGRTITLNGITQQVIGVLPPEFEAPGGPVDLWAPLVLRGGSESAPRASHYLFAYGRLKPGVAFETARSEMDAIGRQLEQQYPDLSRGHGAHVVMLRDEIVQPVRRGLVVLSVAVAFVLLIACTNVANLLLARAAGRRRELAIRAAVGAARSRLLRQALTESIVLAVVSGALGLLVASFLLRVLVTQTPPALRGLGLERATLDPTVLGFTLLLCVTAGAVAGLLPAWLNWREDPGEPLRGSERAPIGPRKRIRFALIVAEVSLTSLLLVGAGLMLRSFERVLSQPSGFETAGRLTAMVTLPRSRYGDADAIRRGRREIEKRLRAIAGVLTVGATTALPFTMADSRGGITIDGYERREGDAPVRGHIRVVTTDYFRAMGIHLAEGRTFNDSDDATAAPTIVINDTMARRYWPGSSALGKRVRFNQKGEPWREVVGVIQDVRHWGLDRDVNPEIYVPHEQQPAPNLAIVLHTSLANAATLVPEVRRLVLDFDPNLPLGATRTMEEVAARSVAARRWSAVLLGSFALLALMLAGVGIYGVMTHLVASRTSEIGIRLTLGARPGEVLRQMVGEGLLHTASGLALGLLVSVALMRGLRTLLYEVAPTDPLTLVVVALTLLAVSGIACFGPALRAMRIDPVQALRFE
jgi:putative ABC transport system permease protein